MLSFPTQAEQVLSAFQSATKTTSLATLAKAANATKTHKWPCQTTYTFDDDTSLVVTGRGKAHRVTVELP